MMWVCVWCVGIECLHLSGADSSVCVSVWCVRMCMCMCMCMCVCIHSHVCKGPAYYISYSHILKQEAIKLHIPCACMCR